jgi:hypothetical protein
LLIWLKNIKGSLSGEHGDGRLRRIHFINAGRRNLPDFKDIKHTWDPWNVLIQAR